MDFSDDERLQILHYLGVSDLYYMWNAELTEIGGRLVAADRVRTILVDLADVDARLKAALDNLSLVKAEDVEFRGEGELEALRNHGRNLINRLAILFGVTVGDDYYGSISAMSGPYTFGSYMGY
jgi:hypothetical protein